MKIVFATNNVHKLEEVAAMLPEGYELLSLKDIGCDVDIPETADTLQGNALQKACYVKEHYGLDCFADDTGLEVEALNGEPGVYSARYAGPGHDSKANMAKLLLKMQEKTNRRAQFRTVIALLLGNETYFFEGIIKGTLLEKPRGTAGFGYDPIFVPEGYNETFAEMGDEKNEISHRAKAIEQLRKFLKIKI
jgi:XTP/dITP diphosphohydrolase